PANGLELDVFFDWFLPMAEALVHAHERGVIHRDIKPGNILITKENVPKILDFGIARILRTDTGHAEGDPEEESLTQLGAIMGTPAYMSPEQAGGMKVGPGTDIFSLGTVMYEALTGRRPFKGKTVQELLTSVLRDEPENMAAVRPEIPYLLKHIVAKSLQKDLQRRYQTVQDLLNDMWVAKAEWKSLLASGRSPWSIDAQKVPVKVTAGWKLYGRIALGTCLLLIGILCGWFFSGRALKAPAPMFRVYKIPLEGVSSPITGGGSSISPDGRMIAYVEDERLRLLDFTTGESTQISDDTHVEQQPFWSPDSRYVGYLTNMGRTIRKAPVRGGQGTTVCDVSALGYVSSATWGSHGDIVFDIWGGDWTRGGGLLRVHQDGGKPEPLVPFDLQRGEGYQAPHYLPDGKGLLFVKVQSDGSSELLLESEGLRRSLSKRHEERIFYPVYCRSGYILYQKGLASDYGIWAVPFSLARLEATGEAFPVAGDAAWPSVSSDGTLAYVSEPLYKQQLVTLNRKGQILSTIAPPLTGVQIGGIALSPDQTRVAFDAFEKGYEDTWLADMDRGTKSRLTFSASRDAEVTWSPDGTRIAFSSEREGLSDIFVQPIYPGAPTEPLVQGGVDKFNPDWSRDGRFLAYEMATTDTRRDLWYIPMGPDGEKPAKPLARQPALFLQTPFDETMPQISPDSRYLAYMSDISGRWEIYVRPFPNGPGEWQISVRGGKYPRWSAQGDVLFYVEEDTLMAAKIHVRQGFKVEAPEELFKWKHLGLYFTRRYDTWADGGRFVAVQETSEGKRFMNVIEHWHMAYPSN
ncbi:MAG: protein kinase, partial [Syntrophobacteraceae bacterium]|nr:protein kinase [Syntrophobacteraceae bacterium]